jgi:hypothetical protein
VVMGGGRSFAFKLIPRTGVQGHTYSLHRTHMGVPHVDCEGPCAVLYQNAGLHLQTFWCLVSGEDHTRLSECKVLHPPGAASRMLSLQDVYACVQPCSSSAWCGVAPRMHVCL